MEMVIQNNEDPVSIYRFALRVSIYGFYLVIVGSRSYYCFYIPAGKEKKRSKR